MAFYPCTNNEIDKLLDGTITHIISYIVAIRNSACYGCNYLTSIELPVASSIGAQAFRDCVRLTDVKIPNTTYISSQVFRGCTSLETIDLPMLGNISTGTFQDCTSLKNLILRKTDSITTLTAYTVFNNSPFDADGTGGNIYVPSALKASYEANANWASLLSQNPNNQILAIEDSPYEN